MTSIKRLLLGSAAATVAITSAQAADAPVMKAPPVQYVRVCTQYGAGFFELPGTGICVKLTGNVTLESVFGAPREAYILVQNAKGKGAAIGSYDPFYSHKAGQDKYGFQLSTKVGLDMRTQTMWGTLRLFVRQRLDRVDGNAAGYPVGGATNTKPNPDRGYMEWAGFLAGRTESLFSTYRQDGMLSATTGDKQTSTTVRYTLTDPFLPKGWFAAIAIEDTLTRIAKSTNAGALGGISSAAAGGVGIGLTPTVGPEKFWDVVGAAGYESDWGSIRGGVASHEISAQSRDANSVLGAPPCPAPAPSNGAGCVANGVVVITRGWAASGTLFLKLDAIQKGDLIWVEGIYGNGALNYMGIGGSQGDMNSLDFPGANAGGFWRADHDAIQIQIGPTFINEKEKASSLNVDLRHFWNDCSIPEYCFQTNVLVGGAWVTPGNITKNVDWTAGGLGNATKYWIGANIIHGVSKKTIETGFEIMYFKLKQDLPCNNGGVVGGVCGTPSVLPPNIKKDPSAVAFKWAASKSW